MLKPFSRENGWICTKSGRALKVVDVITCDKLFDNRLRLGGGSEYAISHWHVQSLLTQGWRYCIGVVASTHPSINAPGPIWSGQLLKLPVWHIGQCNNVNTSEFHNYLYLSHDKPLLNKLKTNMIKLHYWLLTFCIKDESWITGTFVVEHQWLQHSSDVDPANVHELLDRDMSMLQQISLKEQHNTNTQRCSTTVKQSHRHVDTQYWYIFIQCLEHKH